MRPTGHSENPPSDGGVSPVASFSFPRSERLHFKREIDALFAHGKRAFVFPYRLTYLLVPAPDGGGVAMMPIVPKRLFKHAVDRNRYKRRLRAAFRLQVGTLRQVAREHHLMVHMAFLLTSHDVPDYARLHASVRRLLGQLVYEIVMTNH